jgi:trk system potassium uptake protein
VFRRRTDRRTPTPTGTGNDDEVVDIVGSGGVLVVGLGRFGEALALELHRQDIEVLGVDLDGAVVQRLAGRLPNVAQADGTSVDALRQLGAEQFPRAVVAIATDIEASVLTTMALIDELRIDLVWAKALSRTHGEILDRLGVARSVQPEHDMGERTARILARGLTEYFPIEDDFALAEIRTPASLAGKPLGETGLRSRFGVTIVSVKPPEGRFQHAGLDTVLSTGEYILVAGNPKDLDRMIAELK